LYLKYIYFSKSKFNNFPELSDKIYNPYSKTPQNMFRIFWQVWLGEIGKKDVRNAKKNNKKINSKQWNLWRILDFKYLYFLEKCSMIFQKSLIKTVIHKIKTHKNFQNFLTSIDRRNWKENFKNNNKIKNKQIVNCGILKKKIISHIYLFVKELLEISRIHW